VLCLQYGPRYTTSFGLFDEDWGHTALIQHTCYCGKHYDCEYCSTPNHGWMCSTLNGDEDGNLCDECLHRIAEEMQAAFDNDSLGG
jgi:hypothetical protein